jgi:predicted secreted Zn-dependent protease
MKAMRFFKQSSKVILFSAIPLFSWAGDAPVYKYYSIQGTDFKSINESMMSNRPNGANSGNEWHIGWKFTFQMHDGQCYLINPSVSKKSIIILPKWDNYKQGNKAIQKEWMRYSKALKTHQLGHVNFANQAQASILQMFESFQPLEKCSEVKKEANREARAILKKYYAKDAVYEKSTKEGATQGAQLKEP